MTRFKHLNVPDQWHQYFTRYPQGYTLLEALLNWVAQVDNMADNLNNLNENVEGFRGELDEFVERFDPRLQEEVINTLSEWQESGFLDVIIDQALQTQIDTVSDRLAQFEKRTQTHSIIKLGVDAGKNAPPEPVYTGDKKFYKNVAIGGYALEESDSSYNNIVIGWEAMKHAKNGEWSNIAIGNESLYETEKTNTNSMSATRNTGIGINALRFNKNGYQNVAVGRNAQQCTIEGAQNTAIGTNAMSGLAPIGLNGEIINDTPSNASYTTAIGYNSLPQVNAYDNTALGVATGFNLKTATSNTAVGIRSLNKLQEDVTIDGKKKYNQTMNGTYVWSGTSVLVTIPNHGLQNGWRVNLRLQSGDIASSEGVTYTISNVDTNSFTITAPVTNETSGICRVDWYTDNTDNTNPVNNNTSVGANAMQNSVQGEGNTVVGSFALRQNNGSRNTIVGSLAGANLENTNNNSALGYGAMRTMQDGTDAVDVHNATAIGFLSSVSGSNQIQLGNSGVTTYAYGAVQDRSDKRDKADIKETSLGLEFINKLNPVDFKWDYREDYIEVNEETGEVIKHEKDGSKKRSRYHHGLIAQEVQEVMEELGVDFGGFQDHSINGGSDVLSIGYTELIAPLIKAVQELTAKVNELEGKHETN